MEVIKFKMIGNAPLLMHSNRGLNPLDPLVIEQKKITGKRKKTEEDHLLILHNDWLLGIYYDDPEIGAYVPGSNIEACLFEAAALQKLGKVFKRAIFVLEDKIPLQYKGPKDLETLSNDSTFKDIRPAKIGMSSVMRCRPIFKEWSLKQVSVRFNPEQVQRSDIEKAIIDAGALMGICDYTPRYGRFDVEFLN